VLGVDEDGTLTATASDRATGERQSLSVSMSSLAEGNTYDVPDFSLDERYQPELGVSPEEATSLTSKGNGAPAEIGEAYRPSAFRVIAIIFFALVILAIIALLLYRFVLPTKGSAGGAHQPVQTQAAPAAPTKPAAGSEAAPSQGKTAAPVTPNVRYGGVYYYIRWGDTLWDLSMSFYRTPWLYGKIAKANSIKNPDLIFAHTQIYIPDR